VTRAPQATTPTKQLTTTVTYRCSRSLEVILNRLECSEWLHRLNGLLTVARRQRRVPAQTATDAQRDTDLLSGLEAFADSVTVFNPWLVPDLLQTQMYATALTALDNTVQNQARERRQALLRRDTDPLCFHWITSEHALYRRVGGKAVMDDQRALLVELTARPNVGVHVIPGDRDLPPVAPFQVVRGTPSVVVESSRLALHYAHDPGTVEHFQRLARSLRQRALPPEDSRQLIREARG
jgi:hypothetical protein